MTCKEKLMQEHPEHVRPGYPGGAVGCPCHYGYMDEPDFCMERDDIGKCDDCWNSEVPEKEYDKLIYAHIPGDNVDEFVEQPLTPAEKETLNDMRIRDSGNRTQFKTGAVRDMREGKGRCALIPLEVMADMFGTKELNHDPVILDIATFMYEQDTSWLEAALCNFTTNAYNDCLPTMFLEVAKHFEDGAKKYGENNWQKGIPVYCYIDSALRHYLKWKRGDKDEPHDRAFCWNLLCCIWEVDYREKEETNEMV